MSIDKQLADLLAAAAETITKSGFMLLTWDGRQALAELESLAVPLAESWLEMREALEGYADFTQLARSFHELYEALAPEFSYETRKESAVHWDDVPVNNRALMIAVAERIAVKARAALEAEPLRKVME